MMKWRFTVVGIILVLILFSNGIECELDGVGEWKILTQQNFTSQIRLHQHILLLVTVPWCGESRSLMKEISRVVIDKQDEFGSLKLMIVYRNTERMIADAIGSVEGITVSYYHYSTSYKYQGILRAQSILFSIHPYLSVSPEELPLRHLNSPSDLTTFIESTDKSLFLLEFCGWTPRLLANMKKNRTDIEFGEQGEFSKTNFSGKTDQLAVSRRKNQKVMDHRNLMCGVQNNWGGIPWVMQFSSVNDSASVQESESEITGHGLTCTLEGFQNFKAFFSEFISVAREFFLPSERHGFGLVSDRSFLSSLGIEDFGSWSALLHYTGCPSCSKILKQGDDLKSALKMDNSIVAELKADGQDLQPALPANKPSMIMFVDRSCDSSETRRTSKEALNSFREFAKHYQFSDQTGWENIVQPQKSLDQHHQALRSTSAHPTLKLSSTARSIKLKDKMSFMVLDDGKHVSLDNAASDLQGNSMQEVLTYLLQRVKETKLSSLAKDVGFRLLSDDVDIKISNTLPTQTKDQSNQVLLSPSDEEHATSKVETDRDDTSSSQSLSAVEHESETTSNKVESSSHYDVDDRRSADLSEVSVSVESDELNHAVAEDVKVETNDSSNANLGEHVFHSFKGSFFFSDGNYRLLRALTGGTTIPSLVIVDPSKQQHYIFPEETTLSYSSLTDFLHNYLNGSLPPYQRGEFIHKNPRVATPPPFVNLDFHEVDSIPRLTTSTFSKLVIGVNQPDLENASHAWSEDVLVLFSNSWCGFCQRMELVFREVHRAIKGYLKMKSESLNNEKDVNRENMINDTKKPPLIYLMDCTLNDCRVILKSITQREVYPALMLFPAERKEAISYEGDISVADIIKFVGHHGSNTRHFLSEKGIVKTVTEKEEKNQNVSDSPPASDPEPITTRENKLHEIIVEKNRIPRLETENEHDRFKPHATTQTTHKKTPRVVFGSILTATDKLLTARPFEESMIIIVKADREIGFEGLIFNKHISWDVLSELGEGLAFLKKAPLSFGGPLIKQGTPLVALTRGVPMVVGQYPEIIPGVYYLDQSATVKEIEELKSRSQSINDYWFFLGYSSWDWNQLFGEINEGAWIVGDANTGYLTWP